jgi:glycosyltransferase involved in cell wall biosynthesis
MPCAAFTTNCWATPDVGNTHANQTEYNAILTTQAQHAAALTVQGAAPYSEAWRQALRGALGEAVCQQLGVFAVPDDFVLTVVIAAFNEERTLAQLVQRVWQAPFRKQVVLVDDGSTDATWSIMQELEQQHAEYPNVELVILRHRMNRGKGAALRTAFAHAQGDAVIVQDADLEYDPGEYPKLIQPIVDGRADVVFGSRFNGRGPHRVLYFWHYLGNRFLTTLSNMFTNVNLSDMESCYKVFRRESIEAMLPTLKEDRFGIEPELTAKAARRGYRIFEVAISYAGRTYAEGKKIGWKDGLQALWCILRYSHWD